jgi:two-component system, chemotaxis family, sensor kinase CheA
MTPDLPDRREEFLDDFYTECDELLGSIREQLTKLDDACRHARADPAALEALYRHAHSFKGISAMVGLREAEELAHRSEGLIRLFSRGEATLAATHLELLGRISQRLEQIVAAHRLHQSLPSPADLIAQLAAFEGAPTVGRDAPASGAEKNSKHDEEPPAVRSALPGGEAEHSPQPMIWHASFAPSSELDQRGVNINSVRSRLAALGEITSAAPLIQSGGRMSFEYAIALREAPSNLEAWEADGIMLRPGAPTQPLQSPPAQNGDSTPERRSGVAPSSMFVAPSHIVRVDLSRLDDLMRIVGEMVIHRSRLEERIARVAGGRSELHEVNLALGRSLRELREAITRVRLVPIAEVFTRLPFVVRDLERESEKKVRIIIEGQDTEIDKYVVERLKEPLLHLVRNAISHGIETPEQRSRAGKPAEATLILRAATSGQSVTIQIRDDGRGVDRKAIIARATRLGIPVSESPLDSELLDVISRPGFSTRDEADRTSGRGVGMAVVHRTVRDLGGSVSFESEAGQWTQFTLRLPLTLSIAETFLISADVHMCAVPQGFVEEILQFAEADVRTIQGAEVISYRDGILPLIRLRGLFGAKKSSTPQLPLLVLGSERGLCGLVVDKVLGQREVVVRAMHDPLIQVPGVSGATELGDGRPVLILDPNSLSTGAVRPRGNRTDPRRDEPAGRPTAA